MEKKDITLHPSQPIKENIYLCKFILLLHFAFILYVSHNSSDLIISKNVLLFFLHKKRMVYLVLHPHGIEPTFLKSDREKIIVKRS